MKVRAILEYKRIEYERVMVLGAPMIELWRRGKIGKVPALDVDGTLICDSTDIAHELERRFPEPAIIPRNARERGLCHALEEWADESLYFIGIYYQWLDPEGAPLTPRAFERVPVLGRAAYELYLRRITKQVRNQGTGRKPPEHIRRDLERHLDAVQGLVDGREYLLERGPMLCDFALAAQLHYLRRTPVGGRALAEPAAIERYLDRMKAHRNVRPT
jgi:glutathione S-transferase